MAPRDREPLIRQIYGQPWTSKDMKRVWGEDADPLRYKSKAMRAYLQKQAIVPSRWDPGDLFVKADANERREPVRLWPPEPRRAAGGPDQTGRGEVKRREPACW